MESNYLKNGVWAILLSMVLVGAYPLWHRQSPFLQAHFESYGPFSPNKPLSDTLLADTEAPIDSLESQATAVVKEEIIPAERFATVPVPDGPYTGLQHINRFYSTLAQVKGGKKKVRVAYFGDSLIEGDLVTQTLRNELQKRFGGEGVGFVPITSIAPGFRRTIKHSFSDNWKYYSFLRPKPEAYAFGISGEVFLTKRNAKGNWVRYQGSKLYDRTKVFQHVNLFYGIPTKEKSGENAFSSVIVSSDSGKVNYPLKDDRYVNKLMLSEDPITNIKLAFDLKGDLPIYGLSFEGNSGFYLDNFSCRGNSGLNLVRISSDMLKGFNRHMAYDLIILHYGLNVVNPKRKSFNSYKKGMIDVVEHFQKEMPQADILMVSVHDKTSRYNEKFETDPSVPLILEVQREVAQETQVAFLDMYSEMGGRNSMIKWTRDGLANKDYAHFSRRGAAKVGRMVKDFIIERYEELEGQGQEELSALSYN